MSAYKIVFAATFLIVVPCIGSAAPAAQDSPTAPTGDGSSEVFNALDVDRNDSLTLQEFQKGYAGLRRAIALEMRLREQFHSIDANRDGALDAKEYSSLPLVKRAATPPPLDTFDASKDRKLQFGEYLLVVRKLLAQGQKQKKGTPISTGADGGRR